MCIETPNGDQSDHGEACPPLGFTARCLERQRCGSNGLEASVWKNRSVHDALLIADEFLASSLIV
jgi:hypothetical protein